jgi:DNA-binding CsgD family transcriptional regulator
MRLRSNRQRHALPETMIISFALYSAWMLAVPFMGQALRARASELGTGVPMHIDFVATLSIFVSLFATGFFLTKGAQVRRVTPPAIAVGIVGTLVLMGPVTPLWDAAAVMLPVSTGIIVACWGHYYRMFRTPVARLHAAADVIIISNIGMIFINMVAVNLSARLGLGLSVVALIASLVLFMFAHRTEFDELNGYENDASLPTRNQAPDATNSLPARSHSTHSSFGTDPLLRRALALLYIFIMIITVDSGLMYQVVRPAFAHHEFLSSFYWAVPYIGAVALMKIMPERIRRSHILYIAIAMIGFAFILFHVLDTSAASYIVIDTLMLGAFGICDLFWWVILGELLVYAANPVKVFGIGLSANILGVLVGSVAGGQLARLSGGRDSVSAAAIGIVLISLLALPHLYDNLARVIKNQAFLEGLFARRTERDDEGAAPIASTAGAAPIDPAVGPAPVTGDIAAAGPSSPAALPIDPAAPAPPATRFTAGPTAFDPADRIQTVSAAFDLTGREEEIAGLLSRGLTYKMIARELHISENTVKTHIKNIYSKMNVRSKPEFLEIVKITQKV